MSTLTNREKKLIYFTIILAIVVGGYVLLIQPKITSINEKQAYYDELMMEVDAYQLELLSATALDEAYSANLLSLETIEQSIGGYLEDEDVERKFNSLCSSYNLDITTMSLYSSSTNQESDEVIVTKEVGLTLTGTTENCISLVRELYSSSDIIVTSLSMEDSVLDITIKLYMEEK